MDYDKDELNSGDIQDAGTAAGTDVTPTPETEIPPALETYSMDGYTDSDRTEVEAGQDQPIQENAAQEDSVLPAVEAQGDNPNPTAAPGAQNYDQNQAYQNQTYGTQYGAPSQNYPVPPQPQYSYGSGGAYQYQTQPQPAPEKNGMALASLVMGILSLICCCCGYAGIGFGALGIIFALLSRKEEPMCGQAKTGLILSIIGLSITVLVIIVVIFAEAASLFMGGIN